MQTNALLIMISSDEIEDQSVYFDLKLKFENYKDLLDMADRLYGRHFLHTGSLSLEHIFNLRKAEAFFRAFAS